MPLLISCMISPNEKDVERAVSLLRQGKVIAFPTDTLYGLGANPFIVKAVNRIFKIKGRQRGIALPLLLARMEDLSKYASEVSPIAWNLAEAFLPGALTLVLLKSPRIPDYITGGRDTVALRIPNHPVPRLLAERLEAPITGTSANLSGMSPVATAEEAERQFGNMIDLVLDAGSAPKGHASTIVDLTGPEPRILREGAITRRQIEKACGRLISI